MGTKHMLLNPSDSLLECEIIQTNQIQIPFSFRNQQSPHPLVLTMPASHRPCLCTPFPGVFLCGTHGPPLVWEYVLLINFYWSHLSSVRCVSLSITLRWESFSYQWDEEVVNKI